MAGSIHKVSEQDIKTLGCRGGAGKTGRTPGTVLGADRDRIYVATGDGMLALTDIQLEGKKRMNVREFLLGCQISAGEIMESGKK